MILDENVKAISLGVLQQIDLDLVQCEQFAASEPIQGLEVFFFFNLLGSLTWAQFHQHFTCSFYA